MSTEPTTAKPNPFREELQHILDAGQAIEAVQDFISRSQADDLATELVNIVDSALAVTPDAGKEILIRLREVCENIATQIVEDLAGEDEEGK